MLRIALIDDDNTTNFINKTKLSKSFPDAEIIAFPDGQDAIEYLKENKGFDYGFLDLNMPIMNGLEFLSHHLQLPAENKIDKIVLFIEQDIDDSFMKNNELYMNITKPLTQEKIELIFKHD